MAALSLSPPSPSRGHPATPRLPVSVARLSFALCAVGFPAAADVLSLARLAVGGGTAASGSVPTAAGLKRAEKLCAYSMCESNGKVELEREIPKKKCSACNVARYCRADCQVAAWGDHRRMCPCLKEARLAAAAAAAAADAASPAVASEPPALAG